MTLWSLLAFHVFIGKRRPDKERSENTGCILQMFLILMKGYCTEEVCLCGLGDCEQFVSSFPALLVQAVHDKLSTAKIIECSGGK